MTSTEAVNLRMTGKLTFEHEITLAEAAQIIAFLDSNASLAAGSPRTLAPLGTPVGRNSAMSPRDALETAGAKTNPERIVAFAAYVEAQAGKDTFTLDDVRPLFRQARESTPANLSRDLDVAIRSSWIAETETKGEFYLKDQARKILESGFEGLRSGRPKSSKKSSGTRRQRKTLQIPDAFTDIDVVPSMDGFGNYHKLKTKTEKLVWAVNAAKAWGVEAVTNGEVVWLTDKLGDGIPTSQLSGYFNSAMKQGFVNKNAEGKMRITPAGVQHLQTLTNNVAE